MNGSTADDRTGSPSGHGEPGPSNSRTPTVGDSVFGSAVHSSPKSEDAYPRRDVGKRLAAAILVTDMNQKIVSGHCGADPSG
jgi:hypothetical protein